MPILTAFFRRRAWLFASTAAAATLAALATVLLATAISL